MTASNSPRVAPVVPGTRPELAALEAQIVGERGRVSLLYQVLLNSPSLAHGWEAMLTAVRNRSSVPPVLREMAILRVATLNGAPYEFDAHVPHALRAGLDGSQIEWLRSEALPPAGEFNALQRIVLELTDAMTRGLRVPDELFERVRRSFDDERTLVDMVATVAAYNMVSRFLVALDIGH